MRYSHILLEVWSYLGKALIVIGAYCFGHAYSAYVQRKWVACILLVMIIGLFSFYLGETLGTHIEDADPMYGGGDRVTDYEPSERTRSEYRWTMFIVLTAPAIIGVLRRKKSGES